MISSKIIRKIYTSRPLWDSSKKSLLAALRKKTGYAFSNCKKALELNQNDIAKAEMWLKEQATALGWAKAEKLQNRATTQGLVGVMSEKQCATLIEINCETDFVARNDKFQGLAETVVNAVLNHAVTLPVQGSILRKSLDSNTLKNLTTSDGKTLSDCTALTIGEVGENISIKRALCYQVAPDIKLIGCTHPAPINVSSVSFGRYGVLLAYKTTDDNSQLGQQLCQHIIGMNPTKIGDPNIDQPAKNQDEENLLIFQEFLLDSSISVQQLLADTNTEILDFARFEVGEIESPFDEIETGG